MIILHSPRILYVTYFPTTPQDAQGNGVDQVNNPYDLYLYSTLMLEAEVEYGFFLLCGIGMGLLC